MSHSTEETSTVELYVYDLSRGLARSMSLAFVGTHIEAIWHTSVVVYGREYYFGQGIMAEIPGTTVHGVPMEKILMGITQLPRDVFLEYIDNLRHVYSPDQYHLLDNNCNSFTNDVCQFLIGKSIPSHITSLPQDFINTQLATMNGISVASSKKDLIETPLTQSDSSSEGDASQASSSSPINLPHVEDVKRESSTTHGTHGLEVHFTTLTTVAEVKEFCTKHPAVILQFSTASCRPCKLIEPEFKKFVLKHGIIQRGTWFAGRQGVAVAHIDIEAGPSVAAAYSVMAAPTFIFKCRNQHFKEIQGTKTRDLEKAVRSLMQETYHIHSDLRVPFKSVLDAQPVLFNDGPDAHFWQTLSKRLADENLSWPPEGYCSLQALEDYVMKVDSPIPDGAAATLVWMYAKQPETQTELVLTVLKSAITKPGFYEQLRSVSGTFLSDVFRKSIEFHSKQADRTQSATLRLAANLFSVKPFLQDLYPDLICPVSPLLASMFTLVLKHAQDDPKRQDLELQLALSGLLLNLLQSIAQQRARLLGMLPGLSGAAMKQRNEKPLTVNDEQAHMDPEELLEVVSAIMHVLSQLAESFVADVSDEDVSRREQVLVWLVTSIVWCILCCLDPGLKELMSVLNWSELQLKLEQVPYATDRLRTALQDVRLLL